MKINIVIIVTNIQILIIVIKSEDLKRKFHDLSSSRYIDRYTYNQQDHQDYLSNTIDKHTIHPPIYKCMYG